MPPESLKRLNIEHFERLLAGDLDAVTRRTVEHLLAEERGKGLTAYPPIPPPPRTHS